VRWRTRCVYERPGVFLFNFRLRGRISMNVERRAHFPLPDFDLEVDKWLRS
jgi:hypothetical protein